MPDQIPTVPASPALVRRGDWVRLDSGRFQAVGSAELDQAEGCWRVPLDGPDLVVPAPHGKVLLERRPQPPLSLTVEDWLAEIEHYPPPRWW